MAPTITSAKPAPARAAFSASSAFARRNSIWISSVARPTVSPTAWKTPGAGSTCIAASQRRHRVSRLRLGRRILGLGLGLGSRGRGRQGALGDARQRETQDCRARERQEGLLAAPRDRGGEKLFRLLVAQAVG